MFTLESGWREGFKAVGRCIGRTVELLKGIGSMESLMEEPDKFSLMATGMRGTGCVGLCKAMGKFIILLIEACTKEF